jgi:C-terminal processing protease CtpA/Prc
MIRTTGAFVIRTDVPPSSTTKTKTRIRMIGSGFSFDDGEQTVVSVQKPLGIILEQDETTGGRIVVVEVDPTKSAGRAGIQVGDVLVAVQNASTISVDLEEVLDFISNRCPRVVNLRFQRISQQ